MSGHFAAVRLLAMVCVAAAACGGGPARASGEAEKLYVESVSKMRDLAIPPYLTYRTAWESTGLGFDIYRDDKRITIGMGVGGAMTQSRTFAASFRTSDRAMALAPPPPAAPIIGRAPKALDPTWNGAYDIVRYGLHGGPVATPAPVAAASPSPSPGEALVNVSAISAAFYNVEDGGPQACRSGEPGRLLKLAATRDGDHHPLTSVVIENASGRFCTMRFLLRQSGVLGLTGDYELDFAQAGSYWLESAGLFEINVRVLGIAAKHAKLRWTVDQVQTPDSIDPANFIEPTPKAASQKASSAT